MTPYEQVIFLDGSKAVKRDPGGKWTVGQGPYTGAPGNVCACAASRFVEVQNGFIRESDVMAVAAYTGPGKAA